MRKKFFALIAVLLVTISSSGIIFAGYDQDFAFNLPKYAGWSLSSGPQSKTSTSPALVTNLKVGGGYLAYFSVWRYSQHEGKEVKKTQTNSGYTGDIVNLYFDYPDYEKGFDGFKLYSHGKPTNYVDVSAYGTWNVK